MREIFIEMSPQAVGLPDLAPYLAARKLEVRESSLVQSPIPRSTLEMLRRLGNWRLGLATSAERGDVEPVLRSANIQGCFAAAVFRGDVTRHKPAPDPYLAIAACMSVATGLAFEDSDAGITSAVAAGFHAILVDDPENLPGVVSRSLKMPSKQSRKILLTRYLIIDYRLLRITERAFTWLKD
jgi:beta-phosphoglucomutase